MTDKQAQTTGQAINRQMTHIYTWHTDGSVTRARITQHRETASVGMEERVEPPIKHNARQFFAFVPVVPSSK